MWKKKSQHISTKFYTHLFIFNNKKITLHKNLLCCVWSRITLFYQFVLNLAISPLNLNQWFCRSFEHSVTRERFFDNSPNFRLHLSQHVTISVDDIPSSLLMRVLSALVPNKPQCTRAAKKTFNKLFHYSPAFMSQQFLHSLRIFLLMFQNERKSFSFE